VNSDGLTHKKGWFQVSRLNIPVRPRRLRRLLVATAACAILAGTGVGWAADAVASPETDFLGGLNAHGIVVYDTGMALNTGYIICDTLNSTTGDVVAEALYQVTNGDIPDRYTANVWVIEAVSHLCPWHDRQGILA
jgi:hypothetical protein